MELVLKWSRSSTLKERCDLFTVSEFLLVLFHSRPGVHAFMVKACFLFLFQCGYESARIDAYLDIPLVIRPFGSTEAYGSVVRFIIKIFNVLIVTHVICVCLG